jgi:tetratricopeptide (TPR) repeat protein
LGIAAEARGDLALARDRYAEALRLDEKSETPEGRAVSLSHLGDAELALGNHGAARRYYDEGLSLARSVHRLGTLGRCQYGLARVLKWEGQLREAMEQADGAIKSFRQLGMHDMEQQARLVRREAESGLGELQN